MFTCRCSNILHCQKLLYVVFQCLQYRSLNPDESLPELSPVIAASLKPPSEVAENSKAVIEKMKAGFKLEPVAKKEVATGDNIFKYASLINFMPNS